MSTYDIRMINRLVEEETDFLDRLFTEVHKVVVGQDEMIERVFIGLLCGGCCPRARGRYRTREGAIRVVVGLRGGSVTLVSGPRRPPEPHLPGAAER